ncbi:MAG: hypothetical protein OQJ81_06765 [Melioribacteraceae bacterium]|nr:hypothetical protein [Melioribacteraceae bacterium]
MQKHLKLFLLLIIILIGCNESVTEPEIDPGEKNSVDYTSDLRMFFPTDIGDKFIFSVDTLNVLTNSFENIGTRLVSVDNMGIGEELNFFICNETHTIFDNMINSQSKFTITDNSIDFFADSSGVAELIPDSIEIDIKLIFDNAFKLVQYPYNDKEEFKVFNAAANLGALKFNVFSIVGKYYGSELIYLENNESGLESEKFIYTISVNIPDLANPFAAKIQIYNASIWFVPAIGIVKIEGSNLFVSPITGGKFEIADSNKVVRHVLNSYE